MRPPVWLACLSLLALPWPATAQDLAAAAAREKERREKAGKKAQTFTNDDLPKEAPKAKPTPTPTRGDGRPMDAERLRRLGGGAAPTGSAPTAPTPSPSPSASDEGERTSDESSTADAKDEAAWRRRGDAARAAIAGAEAEVVRIQKELDGVRTGQTQPLPIDAMKQVPPNPLTPPPDAGRLTSDLERAKAAVASARQALADLEEEARKAGIPPGWLR